MEKDHDLRKIFLQKGTCPTTKDSRRRKLNDQSGDERPIKSIVSLLKRSRFHPTMLPIGKFSRSVFKSEIPNHTSHIRGNYSVCWHSCLLRMIGAAM